jgi:hypothetical protein
VGGLTLSPGQHLIDLRAVAQECVQVKDAPSHRELHDTLDLAVVGVGHGDQQLLLQRGGGAEDLGGQLVLVLVSGVGVGMVCGCARHSSGAHECVSTARGMHQWGQDLGTEGYQC